MLEKYEEKAEVNMEDIKAIVDLVSGSNSIDETNKEENEDGEFFGYNK